MKIEVEIDFINKITSNEELKNKVKCYSQSIEKGESNKFLQENPMFVLEMMSLAMSDQIKIINDEENKNGL